MKKILEVQGATKHFGGVIANDDVSIHVPEGSIIGLIGPNGSGKTTLFNSIVGSHPLDGGSVKFEGQEISSLRVPQIARLGLLRTFQQTRIFTGMNCLENMEISVTHAKGNISRMIAPYTAKGSDRANELLDFVGLHEKRKLIAGSLSFGQQKLLEFAMALMNGPKLLLLDEPTAGINPTLINNLVDRLQRANKELGISLLVIEHNMPVIMGLAEHIFCLAHGKLLAQGTPEEVKKDGRVLDAYLGAQ